jgi:hypothetical protein
MHFQRSSFARRALVINPWATDFKLYDEWMHPTGLYALISLLRHNGWQVDFINCLDRGPYQRTKKYSTGEFPWIEQTAPAPLRAIPRRYKRYGIAAAELHQRLARLPRPDIVFLGSGMTYWIEGLAETLAAVERVMPGSRVVIGGIAATLMPDLLRMRFPRAIIHSGSLWDAAGAFEPVPGLILHTAGWRQSMVPAFELLHTAHHGPAILTLGCPHSCTYCASKRLQPRAWFRDPALVADEIGFLVRQFGCTDFAFCDDALLYWAREALFVLLDHVTRRFPGIRFHAPNGLHLRWLDREVAQRMVAAGCKTFRFGYESGRPEHARDTSSKAGRNQAAEKAALLRRIRDCSCDVGIYVMAGLPGQSRDQVIEDMRFIGSLGVKVKPVFLSPVPGSALFEEYARMIPGLRGDPHLHNDTFFITLLPGWSWTAVEEIRAIARELNNARVAPASNGQSRAGSARRAPR